MQVLVDWQPVSELELGKETLGDLINVVSSEMSSSDRLVVQIECDDRKVEPAELDATLAGPAAAYEKLNLITESTAALATEGLSSAGQILANTEPGRVKAIEQLATGNIPEAMASLAPCVQGWQRGFEAIVQVAALRGVSLEDTQADGRPVAQFIHEWSDQLRQIKEALEDRDYVLLSDILEYEFGNQAETWPNIIEAVAAQAGLGPIALPDVTLADPADMSADAT